MARKQFVTVTDHPQREDGKIYEAEVTHLTLNKRNKTISATLADKDPSQQGRVHKIADLAYPRPGNQTSQLLCACGANAEEIGERICLDDLVGTHIGVKFNKAGEPVEFVRIKPVATEPTVPANTVEPENESQLSESF